MKSARIDARVEETLRKDIEAEAAAEGRTVSDMASRLLVEAINARKEKKA